MADEFGERQTDELKVLQAIYMDDFVDLRQNNAWKVKQAPIVKLTLVPLESMGPRSETHTHLDMIVTCPDKYPEQVPEIIIENTKGLSNKQIDDLKREIDDCAQQLKGEVMILEIAQHIQQYLHDNNKPPAKSFYEEMLSNKKIIQDKQDEENLKKLEVLKKKEEKERQLLEEEILRRQTAMKEETKSKKIKEEQDYIENASKNEDFPRSPIGSPGNIPNMETTGYVSSTLITRAHASSTSDIGDSTPKFKRRTTRRDAGGDSGDTKTKTFKRRTPRRDSSGDSEDNLSKEQTGGIFVVAFNSKPSRTIHRGNCLGHGPEGYSIYAGIDTSTGKTASNIVCTALA